jgi:hypothetical protein
MPIENMNFAMKLAGGALLGDRCRIHPLSGNRTSGSDAEE